MKRICLVLLAGVSFGIVVTLLSGCDMKLKTDKQPDALRQSEIAVQIAENQRKTEMVRVESFIESHSKVIDHLEAHRDSIEAVHVQRNDEGRWQIRYQWKNEPAADNAKIP